jgi:hypothetical protein
MTALQLLSNPARWGKNRMAVDADGKGVRLDDSKAVKFCLLGGVKKSYPDGSWQAIQKVSDAIAKLFPNRLYARTGNCDINLHRFNDTPATTHADVLKVLTLANV